MAGYLLHTLPRRGAGWVFFAAAVLFLAVMPRLSSAAPIVTYEATDLPDTILGDRWSYDYWVYGPLPAFSVVEIVFDASSYSDLITTAESSGVSSFLVPPDPTFLLDGLLDITPLADIPSGSYETVSVEFTWLGTGAPGDQEVWQYDPSFNLIATGQTRPATPGIPEPPLILLLLTGGLLLAIGRPFSRCAWASHRCARVS